VPTERPATSSEKPEPNAALEKARQMRLQAFEYCMQDLWSYCEKGLDDAKQLDPKGEYEQPVMDARWDIERSRSTFPGEIWKPAEPRTYAPERQH
jgi:hypothetical protein